MTNEAAIRYCDEYLAGHISDIDKEFLKKAKEALQRESCEKTQMVDKSNFSQEQYRADLQSAYDCGKASVAPCEDTVSRQAAIDACLSGWNKDYKEIVEDIRTLPPVTPQQKKGQWINQHIIYTNATVDFKVCSECRYEFSYDAETGVSDANYCPNCGAKMQEVKE